jgi:hypothetical protein
MSQQWEYCALVSHATVDREYQSGWTCRVSYFTTGGVTTRHLKDPHTVEPTDSFERAMAELGAGGWELVSLQHQLVSENLRIPHEQYLASVHVGYSFSPFGAAYFKRIAELGRAIDEPQISLASDA